MGKLSCKLCRRHLAPQRRGLSGPQGGEITRSLCLRRGLERSERPSGKRKVWHVVIEWTDLAHHAVD